MTVSGVAIAMPTSPPKASVTRVSAVIHAAARMLTERIYPPASTAII
jgi:hypothetical protein